MKFECTRAATPAGFVALVLSFFAVAPCAEATAVTLPSVADTHVRSANPNTNFGTWTTNLVGLQADKSGSSPITSRALLHFDVSSLPGGALIKNAAIRLYIDNVVANPADPGPLLITAWPLGASFVEGDGTSGVTWSSQPAALVWPNHTEPMATLAGYWFEIDVTKLVESRLASSDPDNVRILIGATDESVNEVRHFFLRSKEHGTGADGPQLVVEYATGLSSIAITASAEALLSSFDPNSNFGEGSYSWILRNPGSTMRSVSHFNMSGLPVGAIVEHAEVRLSVGPTMVVDPLLLGGVEARRLQSSFVEDTVTWNNQPSTHSSPWTLSNLGAEPNVTFEVDITSIVQDVRAGGDPANLWLWLSPFDELVEPQSLFPFRSDEWAGKEPRLVVYYSPATPTPAPTATPFPGATHTSTPTPTEIGGTPAVVEVGPPNAITPSLLDETIVTQIDDATAFLYTGSTPVQIDVSPGAIDEQRVAVLRGHVRDQSGADLAGLTVTVLNEPTLGSTTTGTNGVFDIAVNGGGSVIIEYAKSGFISVQRQASVPWQDYVVMPNVVMIPYDSATTTIDRSLNQPFQVARASSVSDTDGTRRATILFPQNLDGDILLRSGGTEPLPTEFQVRATEFTVGSDGPERMPAPLPPSSGYTYAVELNVVGEEANEVVFDDPVIFYLENFLGFPTGIDVPAAYYDRAAGVWVPYDDGRVIEILGFDGNGRATLDTDGNPGNDPDNGVAIGITNAERAQLAAAPLSYPQGQTLWRVEMSHFSPCDLNFPIEPPPDAEEPTLPPQDEAPEDEPDCQPGSIIECQNQTLGESIDLVGAPYSLVYRSDRFADRESAYTIDIPLLGGSVPPDLKRVEFQIQIAGRVFEGEVLSPLEDLSTSFTWDGRDAYGRILQGEQPAVVTVSYVYNAVYGDPSGPGRAFGRAFGTPMAGQPARDDIALSRSWARSIGSWSALTSGLGGWTLSDHHALDPRNGTVHFGDGTTRRATAGVPIIDSVAGSPDCADPPCVPQCGSSGDGGAANEALLCEPNDVSATPDGGYLIADTLNCRVRRVDAAGQIETVAGDGNCGVALDGVQAVSSPLGPPYAVAAAPDGGFLFIDASSNRVHRVDPAGILHYFAGSGGSGNPGPDGALAVDAILKGPNDIALGPDGTVYIVDTLAHFVWSVTPDSIIHTFAGNGQNGTAGDSGPATDAQVGFPRNVAFGPDGSVYIGQGSRVRRVEPSGIISTAVTGAASSLTVDRDGALLRAASHFVQRIDPNAAVELVAGVIGTTGFSGDGGSALAAHFGEWIGGVSIAPDGGLLIADTFNHLIRRVSLPPFDPAQIPSRDGNEIHVFDADGRHERTEHAWTGATLATFTYESAGKLLTITDGDDNVTTIQRNGSIPEKIIAPFGQETLLTLNGEGYLEEIENPAGEAVSFTYHPGGGLLATMTDARLETWSFDYDSEGRLEETQDPAGGLKTLLRTELEDGYRIDFSALADAGITRPTRYDVIRLSNADQQRTVVHPDGTQTVMTTSADGSSETELPSGDSRLVIQSPNQRFGMQVPNVRTETESPSELTFVVESSRTVDNAANPTTYTDTTTFNEVDDFTTTFTKGPPATLETVSPEGRETESTLDALGRVTRVQVVGGTPQLYPIRREYDSNGRLEAIKHGPDPTGSVEAPETRITTFEYKSTPDAQNGLLDKVIDAAGREIQFAYDDAGRVTAQTFLADGRVVGFDYDDNGNLGHLDVPTDTAPAPRHEFAYTSVNLESAYTPPDSNWPGDAAAAPTTYLYNLTKDLTQIDRPANETVDFDYDDVRGRLDTVTLPGSEAIEYSYFGSGDDEGKLQSVTTTDAALTFTYDGSLLVSEQWSGGVSGTVTHGYDNRFQTASLRLDSLPAVSFDYDRDGLLTEAGDLELTRDPDTGFLTATALPASSPQVTDATTYSAFGELESYTATYPGGGSYAYTIDSRDALGRITEKSETIGGVTTVYEYAYDSAGRLEEVTVDATVTATYHYDANGNRTAHDGVGGTPIATAQYDDQDRLREYGSATYEYTESGELLSKTVGSDTTTYSYDALGNLRRVEGPGGTPQIDYLVDGRNRRIGKKVNNVLVQKLLYQDQLEPIAEIDAAGNVSVFVYGPKPNVPDYMIRYDSGGTEIGRYRILSDHLGSVRLVLNVATGAIAQRIDYDEFGVVTNDTNPGFQPFGFAGGIWDSDDSGAPHPGSGLVLFGARDYDAAVGRWTAKDPIRFYGRDANLYGYVFNNPVSFTDPTGKFLGIYEEYEAWWGEEEIFGEQAARDPYGGGFRHCMWSCLNRARYGECVADNLNALHDGLYEDPTDVDSVRDITAEQRGHEIGADIPIWGSNAECQRRCAAVYPFPDPNDLTYQLRRRQK